MSHIKESSQYSLQIYSLEVLMTRLKSFYSLRQKAKVQFLRYLLL